MVITVFGLIVILVGVALLWRSLTSMLVSVFVYSIFGATSTINLPALGNTSILPAYLALGFLAARIAFSSAGKIADLALAIRENVFLTIYCVYGAITAFILPRLFAGSISVAYMRPKAPLEIYDVEPLQFTPQNITTAVYVLSTLFIALAASIILRAEGRYLTIVRAAIFLAFLHIGFGLTDLLAGADQGRLLDFLRNASYYQTAENLGDFIRISGSFPEPSGYAGFGFSLFVFLAELWIRNVMPRWTGFAAFGLLCVLCLTTSSTAYFGLAAYAVLLPLRIIFTPMRLSLEKILAILALILLAVTGFIAMADFRPDMLSALLGMIQSQTVNKPESMSGLQRLFWARQGISAFVASHGLGIGMGSFRSSSIFLGVVGSVGVIGTGAFLACLWMVLRPLRWWSHAAGAPLPYSICAAAAWAAVLSLLPAAIVGPSPDPGLLFGFFCGVATSLQFAADPRQLSLRIADRARRDPPAMRPVSVPGQMGWRSSHS